MNQLSLQALNSAKNELSESSLILREYLSRKKGCSDQIDFDFYAFILKRAFFIKEISLISSYSELLDQIVSDLFDLIRYSALQDYRPYYLSLRSFAENFVRLLENKQLSDDHITLNVLEQFRKDFSVILASGDGYSFIKSEYRISSKVIHFHQGSSKNSSNIPTLTFWFRSILTNSNLSAKQRGALYNRFIRLYKIMEKCFIYKYHEEILSSFVRKNLTLTWLIGVKQADILHNLVVS